MTIRFPSPSSQIMAASECVDMCCFSFDVDHHDFVHDVETINKTFSMSFDNWKKVKKKTFFVFFFILWLIKEIIELLFDVFCLEKISLLKFFVYSLLSNCVYLSMSIDVCISMTSVAKRKRKFFLFFFFTSIEILFLMGSNWTKIAGRFSFNLRLKVVDAGPPYFAYFPHNNHQR